MKAFIVPLALLLLLPRQASASSTPVATSHRIVHIDDACLDPEAGLQPLGVRSHLVLAPHTLAGLIATDPAAERPCWVESAALVDARVPQYCSDGEIFRCQREVATAVAHTAAKISARGGWTMRAMVGNSLDRSVVRPTAIPNPAIIFGAALPDDRKEAARWTQAHPDFARTNRGWMVVVAPGSSHDIAIDDPQVVVNAAGDTLDRLRAIRRP